MLDSSKEISLILDVPSFFVSYLMIRAGTSPAATDNYGDLYLRPARGAASLWSLILQTPQRIAE